MNEPKRQHYLPRMYLRGFARDEKHIWVFRPEEKKIFRANARKVAVKKELYTLNGDNDEKFRDVEYALSKIEGAAANVINKVQLGQKLEIEDRVDLAVFLGFLVNRSPHQQSRINDIQEHIARELIKEKFASKDYLVNIFELLSSGENAEDELAKFKMASQPDSFQINSTNLAFTKAMADLAFSFVDKILYRDWTFCVAPKKSSFITTDRPIMYLANSHNPELPFFEQENSRISIPLTSKYLVEIPTNDISETPSVHYLHWDKGDVTNLNREFSRRANSLLVGRDQRLIQSLSRYNGRAAELDALGINIHGEYVTNEDQEEAVDNLVNRIVKNT